MHNSTMTINSILNQWRETTMYMINNLYAGF